MSNQSHFEQVKLFMDTFGQATHKELHTPSADIIKLRLSLILEEFIELYDSCISSHSAYEKEADIRSDLIQSLNSLRHIDNNAVQLDHVAFADALTDIEYVTLGAGLAVGVNLDDTFAEVQRSNMSKLGEDGKPIYREDGKVLKGPLYSPPDLYRVLGVKR